MKFQIETVTPVMATQWLSKNIVNNRPISRHRVEELARVILKGGWLVTHQGIALDRDGNLIDGQHRLSAIVRADVDVQCVVTRYNEDAPMGAFDTGAHRATRDLLVLQGVTTRELARPASAIASAMIQGARGVPSSPAYDDIVSVYVSERESIDWSARALYGRHNAATCAAFAMAYPVAPATVEALATSVMTAEGLVSGTAAHTLHLWLANHRGATQSHSTRIDAYDRVVNAVWYAVRNARCVQLKRSGEALQWLAEARASLGLSDCTAR